MNLPLINNFILDHLEWSLMTLFVVSLGCYKVLNHIRNKGILLFYFILIFLHCFYFETGNTGNILVFFNII